MDDTPRFRLTEKVIAGAFLILLGALFVLGKLRLDAVEAQDNYVALKSEGRTFLKQQTLASLSAVLDPDRFVRVHRSHLLRLEALARLEPLGKGSHVAILSDGTRLPVSRDGLARLKARLS